VSGWKIAQVRYKLHGCILKAKSNLIFSHRDYTEARENNLRLFASLTKSLCEKPFLFVGFGFEDSDFYDVWESVVRYTNGESRIHPTYVVRRDPTPSDIASMKADGFTAIPSTTSDFFPWLQANLVASPPSAHKVLVDRTAPVTRWAKEKHTFDIEPEIADGIMRSCSIVSEIQSTNTASTNSKYFFGAHPEWGDIMNGTPIKRKLEEDILNDVYLWEGRHGLKATVVLGAAGYGKSTLLMQVANTVAKARNDMPVIWIKKSSIMDHNSLSQFCKSFARPVMIVVDDITRCIDSIKQFSMDAKEYKYDVYLLAASRTAEWNDSRGISLIDGIHQLRMTRLSLDESERLATKLHKSKCLSADYNEMSVEDLKDHFYNFSEQHIIAGLLTATKGGTRFDEIIANEYHRIELTTAKHAYKLIALLHSFGFSVPWNMLGKLLDSNLQEFIKNIEPSLEDIVIADTEATDLMYRAQHRVIAEELILHVVNPSDVVGLLNEISRAINPHDQSQRAILIRLYSVERLQRVVPDHAKVRACYQNFLQNFPDDPFILQHSAIFEASTGRFDTARSLIDKSIAIAGRHPYMLNTLGNIWLKDALSERDQERAEFALRKGVKLIREQIARDANKEIHYHSLVDKLIKWADKTHLSEDQRINILEEAQDDLDRALRLYPTSSDLLALAGDLSLKLKEIPEAEGRLTRSLQIDAGNTKARLLLANLLMTQDEHSKALICINGGLEITDRSAGLLKARIMCLNHLGSPWDVIKPSIKDYLRVVPKDYVFRLELIKGLVESSELAEASKAKEALVRLDLPYSIKINLNYELKRDGEPIVVSGRYSQIRLAKGYLKIDGYPDRLDAFVDITSLPKGTRLRDGQTLKGTIGLNGFGLYLKKLI
jgi:tetratricopeptide (TPR) repeat protein